jgi:hypothetical protein
MPPKPPRILRGSRLRFYARLVRSKLRDSFSPQDRSRYLSGRQRTLADDLSLPAAWRVIRTRFESFDFRNVRRRPFKNSARDMATLDNDDRSARCLDSTLAVETTARSAPNMLGVRTAPGKLQTGSPICQVPNNRAVTNRRHSPVPAR